MTPDERGQRMMEVKERHWSNYDVTINKQGTSTAWAFTMARDDVDFLLAEIERVEGERQQAMIALRAALNAEPGPTP